MTKFREDSFPSTTSESLILRLQANDGAAWQRCHTLYGSLMRYWCNLRDVPQRDWNDIRQEVMADAAKHIGHFQRHKNQVSFRPWLRTICMVKIADYFRKLKNQPPLLSDTNLDVHFSLLVSKEPIPGKEADDTAETQVLYLQMLEMIKSRYDEKSWEAFYQTAVVGMKSHEVAQMLDMTAANVRKIKSRIIAQIKEEFDGLLD